MITLYGIKNCDTVRKARKWLDSNQIDYQFHDFRVDGLNPALISSWLQQQPLDKLVNKRSTTWKGLTQADKDALSEATAPALCANNATLVKRPVLNKAGTIHLGFSDKQYQDIFT